MLRLEKHFFDYCDRKQQNIQYLLIKATHTVVYMQSLLCVLISQYSNNVELFSMGEAQMWGQRGVSGKLGGLAPAATAMDQPKFCRSDAPLFPRGNAGAYQLLVIHSDGIDVELAASHSSS